MQSLNIVHLIESNPITKLTNVYNNKFLTKIQENFSEIFSFKLEKSCCGLNEFVQGKVKHNIIAM